MRRLIALVAVSGMALLGMVAVTGPAQAKVSGPNGQTVFSRNDDIFVINPDGSHEHLLVPGPHEQPVWSPDGSRVAMSALSLDGRVTTALVNANGSGYVLEPLPDPTLNLACGPWKPNGSRLACLGFDHTSPNRHEGVFTVRASDWGGLVRVTSNPCLVDFCEDDPGDFSPDGARIVFVRHDPLRHGGNQALFVVNTDGTGLKQITPWGFAPFFAASWSPDGRWILFDARGRIFVTHPDGTGLRQIPIRAGGGRYFAQEPAWSPNGRSIVLSLFLPKNAVFDIYTMRADGSHLFQVTHSPPGEDAQWPDWGPHPLAG